MLHPATKLRSLGDSLGTAVVASQPIPAGTIVWVQDPLDRVLDTETVASFPPLLLAAAKNHGYFDREGRIVLCWDHARYVNHSCEPNCLSPGLGFELAVRDIAPGEALTNDYLSLNLHCDFACACGAGSCRGLIHSKDAQEMAPLWDAQIRRVLQQVRAVPQPLAELLQPEDAEALRAAIEDGQALRSSSWHLSPSPLPMPAPR